MHGLIIFSGFMYMTYVVIMYLMRLFSFYYYGFYLLGHNRLEKGMHFWKSIYTIHSFVYIGICFQYYGLIFDAYMYLKEYK